MVLASCAQTAPLVCPKPADPEKAVSQIPSDYLVVNFAASDLMPPGSWTSIVGKISANADCKYRFKETKKNPNQIPQVLQTAECQKDKGGICDPRCKAITYMVAVLRKNENCDAALGVRLWTVQHVQINISYEM